MLSLSFMILLPGSRARARHREVHARASDVHHAPEEQGRALQGQLLSIRLHPRQVRRRQRIAGERWHRFSRGIASAVAAVVQSVFEKYMAADAVAAAVVALHTFGLVCQSIWATLVEVEELKRVKGQRPYRS